MAPTTTPANTPSLGPIPNPHAPNPLYPFILATVLLCSILTTIITAARLITKRLVSTYSYEDYFLILAYVFNIAYDFVFLAAGRAGLGRHFLDVGATGFPILAKYGWALELLYTPTIWLAKTALLFQLIRIFSPMKSGPVYWASHSLIWGNLAFYTAILFSLIFECHPIEEVWNPFYADGGHCINRNASLIASGAVNVFSDLLNLLLPVWATLHLQMAPKRKAGVAAIFTIGILAFVSSICRLAYSIRITTGIDFTYTIAQTGMWTLAEIASIILCTCFPMMPRLTRLISDRYSSYRSSSSSPSKPVSKRSTGTDRKYETSSDARGVSTHELNGPYKRSGDHEGTKTSDSRAEIHSTGTHEHVSIELTTRDRLERESHATSMV